MKNLDINIKKKPLEIVKKYFINGFNDWNVLVEFDFNTRWNILFSNVHIYLYRYRQFLIKQKKENNKIHDN